MPLDVKVFYIFNNLAGKSAVFDALTIFSADYLEYLVMAIFLLFLFFSAYSNGEKIRLFLVAAASTILSRFIITEIIRFFYHRPRPFLVLSVQKLVTDNEYSFPSGHAAFFFALAMAIYFYNKKWGAWFFIAAILMTFARVVAGVHYPTDILGGAVIGIASAFAIYYLSKKWPKNR